MNIREIAKAAGVSPSTVSRVLNQHDSSIAPETRQRVQRIIKDVNYIPYARPGARPSHLLGVILHSNDSKLLQGIYNAARSEGYCTIVNFSENPADDQRNFQVFLSHHVDGILWERDKNALMPDQVPADCQSIPCIMIDPAAPADADSLYFDMAACGAFLTEELIRRCHSGILCLSDHESAAGRAFETGYRQAMYRHALRPETNLSLAEDAIYNARVFHSTAAVCESYALAGSLLERLRAMNTSVPLNFSLATLCNDEKAANEHISYLLLSSERLGQNAILRLIGRIERRELTEEELCPLVLSEESSISSANVLRTRRVVVVGALNMDTLMRLPAIKDPVSTVTVLSRTVMPRGKALNQAVACKKLGTEVNLIGCLGHDYEGAVLHSFLQTNGISTAGVSMDQTSTTGYACVTINADGESSVMIDRGANKRLGKSEIDRNEDLFNSTGFCLLQTELNEELALYCARLAHKHGARVILKPCNQPELTDELLQNVDFLIPNHHELNHICPGNGTLEEKAQHLLDRGAACVIVTCGSRGCYMTDGHKSRHFPAAHVHVVDTTGACDAFAAALAVFLMRGETLETAIEYATCAAGLSTEQQGVPAAVPDLATVLQFYQNNWEPSATQDEKE